MFGVVEPTQKSIAGALKRWSKLRQTKARIEAERERTIAPIKERFEQRCAPANLKAAEKLQPVEAELRALEAEITKAFEAGIDEKGGIKISQVSTATAIAEVRTSTERELDPQLFLNEVPPSRRDAAFYSCLKTLIGKAERFLGATRLNELAHAKRRHTVTISEVAK